MVNYRLAGHRFSTSSPVAELSPFKINATEPGAADEAALLFSGLPPEAGCHCEARGWVANGTRQVEVEYSPGGIRLLVQDCGAYILSLGGTTIARQDGAEFTLLDRQVICGPLLVLALARHGIWCLHASAALHLCNEETTAFLGESGQGKSTLASFLSTRPGWTRVADDILPVTLAPGGLIALPRFPQLKLPIEAQPGADLPEKIPLRRICILTSVDAAEAPELKRLAQGEAVQALLSSTAGARLFSPAMLAAHLDFCARAAAVMPIYSLAYPHRLEALPQAGALLENPC